MLIKEILENSTKKLRDTCILDMLEIYSEDACIQELFKLLNDSDIVTIRLKQVKDIGDMLSLNYKYSSNYNFQIVIGDEIIEINKKYDYIDFNYIRNLAIELSDLNKIAILIHTSEITEIVYEKGIEFRIDKYTDIYGKERKKIQYMEGYCCVITEII